MPNRDDRSWLDALSDTPLNLGNYPGYAAGAGQWIGNAALNIGKSLSFSLDHPESPISAPNQPHTPGARDYNMLSEWPESLPPAGGAPGVATRGYMGLPPMITETAAAWDRLFGEQNNWHDGLGEVYPGDMNADAATAALAFYGGNALNPLARVPRGSVASGAMREGASALDMSPETRLARKADNDVWYHGTPNANFDRFDLDGIAQNRINSGFAGVSVTKSPFEASEMYASALGEAPGVFPLWLDVKNPFVWDISDVPNTVAAAKKHYPDLDIGAGDFPTKNRWELSEALRDAGFDAIDVTDKGRILERAAIAPNTVRSATTGETIFSDNKPSILGAAAATADQPQGITAYHGSPHDFDKFSLDKIGTGEGAQAYGHGLYFAENEGVARSYRDSLSHDGLGVVARGRLRQHGGDVDKTIEYLRGRNLPNDVAALAELENAKASGVDAGRMYQVRINADPNDFLDWDKPLSQQPGAAQKAIQSHPAFLPPLSENPDNFMRNAMRDPETSNMLREAGIPGIRYLDGNSRGSADVNDLRSAVSMWEIAARKSPNDQYATQMLSDAKAKLADAEKGLSSNYVVFDDSLIDILKKYGLTGAVLGAGALGLTGTEASAEPAPQYDPELEDIIKRYQY